MLRCWCSVMRCSRPALLSSSCRCAKLRQHSRCTSAARRIQCLARRHALAARLAVRRQQVVAAAVATLQQYARAFLAELEAASADTRGRRRAAQCAPTVPRGASLFTLLEAPEPPVENEAASLPPFQRATMSDGPSSQTAALHSAGAGTAICGGEPRAAVRDTSESPPSLTVIHRMPPPLRFPATPHCHNPSARAGSSYRSSSSTYVGPPPKFDLDVPAGGASICEGRSGCAGGGRRCARRRARFCSGTR